MRPEEEEVWRALYQAIEVLPHAIEAELRRSSNLTLHDYKVLNVLAGRSDRSIRVTDLANSVPMSLSGLSRLVDRLGRRGLIERERSFEDRRSQLVVLTAAGEKLAESSKVVHSAFLCRTVFDNLRGFDLERLTRAFEAMASSTE